MSISGTAASTTSIQLQTLPRRRKVPPVSQKQRNWLRTPSAKKALGAAGVKEWEDSDPGGKLPMRVGKRMLKKRK